MDHVVFTIRDMPDLLQASGINCGLRRVVN
jgi:hypothetical protein